MRSAANIKSHPLHPILVVFPLAFFTGALVFDLVAFAGGYHLLHAVAYYLCVAGVTGAVLAAIPGLIDLLRSVPPRSSARRRGVTHGLLNSCVLVLFVVVIFMRREGFGWPELALELLAVGLMVAAGWMGGTLVHRNQIGIDHRYAGAGKWNEERFSGDSFPLAVAKSTELQLNQMKLLHINNKRIVLARTEEGFTAFDDRCTHRGASLADGALICGRVQCPWHGSQFDVKSGECLIGPAETRVMIYKVEERDGQLWFAGF